MKKGNTKAARRLFSKVERIMERRAAKDGGE